MAVALGVWTVDRAAGRGMLGQARGTTLDTTCAALAEHGMPDEVGHLVLRGCSMDLETATVVRDGNGLEVAYVSLVATDQPTLGDVPVVYRLQDRARLEPLEAFMRLHPPPDAKEWFDEHVNRRLEAIDGTVLRGRHASATDADHLGRHALRVGDMGAVLVDRQRLASPWPTAVSGLVFLMLAVWGLVFPPSGIVAGTGRR